MRRLNVTIRYLLLHLTWILPLVLLGWVFSGFRGAWMGGGLGVALSIYFEFKLFKFLIRLHGAQLQRNPGLLHSLRQAAVAESLPAPAVYVFSDPSPNVLVMRSWVHGKAILLSSGILAALTEAELRSILGI